jgi:hypothetical protein
MADESYVQIEVPRTGQKIRNLSTTLQQPDGTIATVLMQVVALANADGSIVQQPGDSVWDAAEDTGWNQHPSAMNFDLTNQLTIDNVWES